MAGYQIHKKRKKSRLLAFAVAVLILFGAGVYTSLQLLGGATQNAGNNFASSSTNNTPNPRQKTIDNVQWPSYGQSAYGVLGEGVLAESKPDDEPIPIASLAKVITALAIMEKKPLELGEKGPAITINQEDVNLYHEYVAKQGTFIPVHVGQEITQYNAMQAMLLQSANNISDSMAIWAFGSLEEYKTYATEMLHRHGINNTTVAGASGYSELTKSTAEDMVRIGLLYMQDPVLRELTTQKEAFVPGSGTIISYHADINEGPVAGIKIGYTEEAGMTFLAADTSNDTISVAAVLGAKDKATVLKDVKRVLESGNASYEQFKE